MLCHPLRDKCAAHNVGQFTVVWCAGQLLGDVCLERIFIRVKPRPAKSQFQRTHTHYKLHHILPSSNDTVLLLVLIFFCQLMSSIMHRRLCYVMLCYQRRKLTLMFCITGNAASL